jgi:hypothetical protein
MHLSCLLNNQTTRENEPLDLLAELDYDQGMGHMRMDSISVGSSSEQLWLIENRGLAAFQRHELESVFVDLFLSLSKFNELNLVVG